jgi:tetratricopeptide (TPR) repeat protein
VLTELRLTILILRDRQDAALPLVRKMLESSPNDPRTIALARYFYRRQGDWNEVRRLAELSLAQDSQDFSALDALAASYINAGEHEQAKPILERALRSADDIENDLSAPFSVGARPLIALLGMFVAIWRGKSPSKAPTADIIVRHNKEWFIKWKEWANGYLAWHSRVYGSDGT